MCEQSNKCVLLNPKFRLNRKSLETIILADVILDNCTNYEKLELN